MTVYMEEEIYWIYRDERPFTRSKQLPTQEDMFKYQSKHPTSRFRIVREQRVTEEVRSFAPIQREDKYRV